MTIPNVFANRISRLQSELAQRDVDLAAIAPSANMRYLLGFAPLPDERPCALLVSQDQTRLVVPSLNADQVERHTGMQAVRWDDATGPRDAFVQAVQELGLDTDFVLAVDDTMRADALLFLQDLFRPVRSLPAGDLMSALRVRKTEAELDVMQRAAELADTALLAGVEACVPGASEREVADVIADSFLSNGADAVEFIIVASGPNSAFPHHETGDRRLQDGDTIIIDIGCLYDGYVSDLTRVVHLGQPTDEVRAVYDAVLEANRRGRAAAVAGARASEVDRAARGALEGSGYGEYFVHRTGHGLGLEVHEPPWITSENDTRLEPGMVFSVEPGVYLPNRFGVRIEDIVVVTADEPRLLTGVGHDLFVKR